MLEVEPATEERVSDIIPLPGFAEPIASFTHLFAAPFALVFGFFLLRRGRGEPRRTFALLVYLVGIVSLLAVSGTYHSLDPVGPSRFVLRHLDFTAIWLLIAGTFTPIHVIALRGPWRWGMLAVIWGFAIVGITLETVYLELIPGWLAVTLFLVLGWMGALSSWRLAKARGFALVKDCIYGGIAYSVGATFEGIGHPTLIAGVFGPHELFHVAVLVGIVFHGRFVWRFADESTFGEALAHARTPRPSRPIPRPVTAS